MRVGFGNSVGFFGTVAGNSTQYHQFPRVDRNFAVFQHAKWRWCTDERAVTGMEAVASRGGSLSWVGKRHAFYIALPIFVSAYVRRKPRPHVRDPILPFRSADTGQSIFFAELN